MGAAIQEKQKGRLTHSKDSLLAAKREGRSFATDDFVADDRDLQADLLVQILPDHCLQKLLGLPWDSIDEMEPEEVLHLFRLKARARHYSAAKMSRFRNAYCKVTAWLELKGYSIQPDGSVAAVHITMYLDELRTTWHENKNAKEMETQEQSAEVPPLPLPLRAFPRRKGSPGPGIGGLRVSSASEKPREGKRTQHGATVGYCAWRVLSFGERKLYLPWDMSNVDIETGVKA